MLTLKGMELMDEAFNNVKVQKFKVHLTEHKKEHTAIVSKNSTSHREYSVNIPKSDTFGSREGQKPGVFMNPRVIPPHVLISGLERKNGI